MTLTKLFLAGGITFAVSEYKWVRMEQGAKLSQIDVYDGCTRGVGGIIRVLHGLRFDVVLIPAIIFQLGLISMGPSAQQILSPSISSTIKCSDPTNPIDLAAPILHYSDITRGQLVTYKTSNLDWDPLSTSLKHDYVLQYAAAQAALVSKLRGSPELSSISDLFNMRQDFGLPVPPRFKCDSSAINCTYTDVPGFFTMAQCRNGSPDTRVLDPNTGNVTTVSEHYKTTSSTFDLPSVMYAESMYNRTFYDLSQLSSRRRACTYCYGSSVRNNFGDQNFVLATASGTMYSWMDIASNLTVYECTLKTFLNRTTYVVKDNVVNYTPQSSTAVQIDYDQLSNATYLTNLKYDSDYTQITAYAFQISILKLLTSGEDSKLGSLGSLSKVGKTTNALDYLNMVLGSMDTALTLAIPWDGMVAYGVSCHIIGSTRHAPDPRSFYPFVLCMLIPLIWWVMLWITSLYYSNGVARGNSQVALVVAGLTSGVQNKFQGLSHADQPTLFKRANEVDVKFGEVDAEEMRQGHAGFGLPSETHSIRRRQIVPEMNG
ncbi:hypothetical protein DFQ28_010881 [Apophysomyces sp. BC1034]|nr:hypothetical protein DFQ29_009209 [Apophysomyces sp. BC1021]KAG0184594.1 hypothetical protein DFQ28_010881 [Apophysomyces sp. BC1034]